jgi:hypothetical protein
VNSRRMYLDYPCRFIADPGVKDVQVAGQGQGNDVPGTAPRIAHLLVINSGSEVPCRECLAGLGVPWGDINT